MKKRIAVAIVLLAAIIGGILTIGSLTHIEQGEVGVVWTSWNGVQKDVLTAGTKFIHPLAKVKKYPISQQQIVFSNNPQDYNTDKHADWHIDAPADGGMVAINATVNYQFIPEKVTMLYTKFNGMDGETIVDNMVQNSIIAYIKEVTPQFSVMDIYSGKRSEVNKAITEHLNNKLSEEYGIHVPSALIIDAQPDETLMAKIQAKEQAKQDAEKAELDKQTALAQAETDKVRAEAKAAVMIEEARGEAEAYRIKSEQITDNLLKKWELDARAKHGWVTIQGANTIVTNEP